MTIRFNIKAEYSIFYGMMPFYVQKMSFLYQHKIETGLVTTSSQFSKQKY